MAEELLQGNNEKLTSVSVSILKNLDLIPGWYGRFSDRFLLVTWFWNYVANAS